MESVFLHLLNMSVTAGWLVLAVVVLRLVFRRAPKWIHCLLWVLVAVRLLCPVSMESALSLIPSTETVPVDTFLYDTPAIHSGVPVVDAVVNPVISHSFAPRPGDSVNPMQVVSILAANVWVLGMVAMVLYALISTLRLRHRVREAACVRDNVWQCDRIATPFILGVFRPRIYLPTLLGAEEAHSVVAHEQAHLARRDHWWKPLGFLLLTVYWFNPLLWVGYILLCRDIEAACDERVVRDMDTDGRREYSRVLLACSAPRHVIAACPLAFGETGVKTRIKSVLHYKKPAFWLVITALVATVVAAVCLLTNPRTSIPADMDAFLSQAILEHNRSEHTGDAYPAEAHTVFGTRRAGGNTTVYGLVLYDEYYMDDNGDLQVQAGSHIPTILTVGKDADGNYTLVDYWIPRDGADYARDIRDRFPARHQGKALNIDGYYEKHRAATLAQAQAHFAAAGNALTVDTYTASFTFAAMNHLPEAKREALYANVPTSATAEYLPVLPITTRRELDAFVEEYKKEMHFDRAEGDGLMPIHQMSFYDDAFFAEHILLAVYYADGSCSVEPKIGGLVYGADALQVQVDVYEPEAGDTALGQWFMLCEVQRSAVSNVQSYTAVVRSRVPMEYANTFTGRVTQVTADGKAMLMDCYDTDKFREVWVSLRNIPAAAPAVGEEYTVTHTGVVQETYPPQVTAVSLVRVSSTPTLLNGTTTTNTPDISDDYPYRSGDFAYDIRDGEIIILAHLDMNAVHVDVPAQIDGLPVTRLGGGGDGFRRHNVLESVTLPEGLGILDETCFDSCRQLKTVVIPSTVTTIGDNPFWGCSSMETMQLATGNTAFQVVDGVLYDKTGEKLIAYPEGKEQASFYIPDSVKIIKKLAFGYRPKLKDLYLTKTVALESRFLTAYMQELRLHVYRDTVLAKELEATEVLNHPFSYR